MPGPLVSEDGGTCHRGQPIGGVFPASQPPASTTPSHPGEGRDSPYAHCRTLSDVTTAYPVAVSHLDRDVANHPFSLRSARWRTWLRVHTPNVLYYGVGLVVPKARDCGNHEWHNEAAGIDGCYHCEVTRSTPLDAPWFGTPINQPDETG